jgi:hypothetical protein
LNNVLNDERIANKNFYFILELANLLRRFATQQAMPARTERWYLKIYFTIRSGGPCNTKAGIKKMNVNPTNL